MKNYLFAPFKDDKEKVEEFNHFRKYLPKGHQNRLVIFIGRLESYYDVITSKLQADESESIGWIEQYRKGCKNYRKEIDDLKAENERLKDRVIKRGAESEELKAELKDEKYYCKEMVSKLQAENEDLRKGCKLLKDTSHYPKEYKAEADEYFNNNPQSKGVRFHMIDFNEYDYDDNEGLNGLSGEYNGLLFAEDCLIEIDNNEGSN